MMIDEQLLIKELNFRVRTPRSTMEIIRDIIPLVEMQPTVSEQEIRNKAIEEFTEKIVNRCEEVAYNTTIDGVPNVDILTLDGVVDDVWDIAEQMKEVGE